MQILGWYLSKAKCDSNYNIWRIWETFYHYESKLIKCLSNDMPIPAPPFHMTLFKQSLSQLETVETIRSTWVTWQLEKRLWIRSISLKATRNAGEWCKVNRLQHWKYTGQSAHRSKFYTLWLLFVQFQARHSLYSSLYFVPYHLLILVPTLSAPGVLCGGDRFPTQILIPESKTSSALNLGSWPNIGVLSFQLLSTVWQTNCLFLS